MYIRNPNDKWHYCHTYLDKTAKRPIANQGKKVDCCGTIIKYPIELRVYKPKRNICKQVKEVIK